MDAKTILKIFPSGSWSLHNHQYERFDEKENDIQLILDWLDPGFPLHGANSIISDPLPRVKAAIRSCLKDDSSQMEFVQLYQNTITRCFNKYIHTMFDTSTSNFIYMVDCIRIIKTYIDGYTRCLNLSVIPLKSFKRHLNSLLRRHILNTHHFIDRLEEYFCTTLFDTNRREEIQNCVETLNGIDFTNEVNSIVVQVSIAKTKEYVLSTCSGNWSTHRLSSIKHWIEQDLYQYFRPCCPTSTSSANTFIKIAHDELVLLRIKEIYHIITNFPSSEIALRELHQCILLFEDSKTSVSNGELFTRTNQREKLVNSFIDQCNRYLLHSGADTIEIVTFYASTIKSFLIIDPRGVLLDKVVRPIRRYVKTRSDIIPKLVHGFLDDSESNRLIEIAKELRKRPKKNVLESLGHDDLNLNWTPDPIDALPDFRKGKRKTDIIESIISIFDLKAIFIEEFTTLFGNRLLNLKNYDICDIEENLRLLKLRFGESEFSTLEIMIRDVINSKQTNESLYLENASIFSNTELQLFYHPKILSHLYWPMLENSTGAATSIEEFKLPQRVVDQFVRYNKLYGSISCGSGRTLKPIPSLGVVNLNLELQGKNFQFEVTPAEASVISLFDNPNGEDHYVKIEDAVDQLQMTQYNATQHFQLWIKRNVIVEVETGTYMENPTVENIVGNIDNPVLLVSTRLNNIGFTKMDSLWPLLVGMLTNLGSLPLEKILTFLNITVPKKELEKYTLTSESLSAYLNWCSNEGKLVAENGLYCLKK